jgi:hypothetical protein
MIDSESLLNLTADEPGVASFLAEHYGELIRDVSETGVYWLVLHPRSVPAETFIARVAWQRYPQRPPSVKFATAVQGGLTSTAAWPLISGYRAGSFDICMPFTAEGFALHPEWSTGVHAWKETGNPFLWVTTRIQDDFNQRYGGRAA